MLKRLRGRSTKEIRTRAYQGLHIAFERLRVSKHRSLPAVRFRTGAGFIADRDLTAADIPCIEKPDHIFYPSIAKMDECLAVLRSRYEGEVGRIISIADRICEGKFDLLGYRELSFGGRIPDWHLDPVTGLRSPLVHWSKIDEINPANTGDKKVIWELNRHQFFVVLGQAYRLTKDERYAECYAAMLSDWMDTNPPKLGVNWLSSLELAFRSISWIWAFYLFSGSSSVGPELLAMQSRFLVAFGRHIETYLSTYFSPNTHLTGEALGLYFLGTFLPEMPDADRWKRLGHSVMVDALNFQVRDDGTYCEQSTHYIRYTIDFYCSLLLLRRLEGYPSEPLIESKLNGLFDCLMHTALPNGHDPKIGDDDGGRLHFLDGSDVNDLRPTFALGAVLLGRSDLKAVAEEPSAELLWTLGTDGLRQYDALARKTPEKTRRAFRDGGVYAARRDWSTTADSILIDCGPHGFLNGGHAHADALSFVLAVDGKPVLIDSGTYNYTAEPAERRRFRSSAAHNCLTVNGESSAISAGPFSWMTTTDARLIEWHEREGDGIFFRGTHHGFERFGVAYERAIEFEPGKQVIVEERIKSDSANRFEVNFILAPELRSEVAESTGRLRIVREGTALLEIDSEVDGQLLTQPTWRSEPWLVSPVYGARETTEKLVYVVDGSGKVTIRNRIVRLARRD